MCAVVTLDLKEFWAPVVALWAAIAASLALYKDYLAVKKTKLEIEKLKSELKKSTSQSQLTPVVLQKAAELFEKIMVRSDFQFSAAIKAFFLCLLISGLAIGYVWQKSQIYEEGKIVQDESTRLQKLKNVNINLSSNLLQIQQIQKGQTNFSH